MTTYTVYNTQDSSSFESGLTLDEATREFWSHNVTVRDYNDALYVIVTDEDFAAGQAVDEDGDPIPHTLRPVKPANWK